MGQQVQDGKNRCESAKLINSKGKNKIKLAEQSGSVTIETSKLPAHTAILIEDYDSVFDKLSPRPS